MIGRRAHLALIGLLAVVLCFGLSTGTAGAKKKGKRAVTVAKTTPTTIPPTVPRQPPGCLPFPPFPPCTTAATVPLVTVPLRVGKKAKGKVVSDNSVSITFTITGTPPAGPTAPGSANQVQLSLTAPNGRTVFIGNPAFGDANATTIGPVTVTPNSPFAPCPPDSSQATTVCATNDPDFTVRPPNWTGTMGNSLLANFGGVPARGNWTVRARNTGTGANATLSSVSIHVGLAPKPSAK